MEGIFFGLRSSKLILRNIVTTDSNNGITIISSGLTFTPEITISYTSIIGLGLIDCVECYENDPNTCSHLSGLRVLTSMITTEELPGKLKMPIHRVKANAPFEEGFYTVRKIEFKNFNNIVAGRVSCTDLVSIHANNLNADTSPVTTISQVSLNNVNSSTLVRFYDPLIEWLAYHKFNCRLENCLGPYNVIIRDIDGTFMGTKGALISYNPGATNGTCEEVPAFHGFNCT